MTTPDSIDLAGSASVVTSGQLAPVALSQTIDRLKILSTSQRLAPGAAFTTIPLGFVAPTAEAVVVLFFCSHPLQLEITSAGSDPGPVVLGVKGHQLFTLTPGDGITQLRVANPSLTEARDFWVYVGNIPDGEQTPEFYE